MTIFILRYLFLFVTGAVVGWILEVFYRRWFGLAKRWINPGFLSGPFLPLYGTGTCLLYAVSEISVPLTLKIPIFAVMTTCLELATGMFFLRHYKTRLWDYSDLKFNFRGIIAPLYTFYWTVLSLLFYFVLYPHFYKQIEFIYSNLEFSLFIGIVLGIMFVDGIESFGIAGRLKDFAENTDGFIVDYDRLKLELREKIGGLSDRMEELGETIETRLQNEVRERIRKRPTFMHPFRGEYDLEKYLRRHAPGKFIKKKDE